MLKNQQRPISRRGNKSLLYIQTSTCHTVTVCAAQHGFKSRPGSAFWQSFWYTVFRWPSFCNIALSCSITDVVAHWMLWPVFHTYQEMASLAQAFLYTTVLFPCSTAGLLLPPCLSDVNWATHTHKGSGMQQFPSILQELLGLWRGSWGPSISSGWWRTWTYSLDVEWAADKVDFFNPFDVYMIYSSNILVHGGTPGPPRTSSITL